MKQIKIKAIILSLVIAAFLSSGCSGNLIANNALNLKKEVLDFNAEGYPIAKEPITLKIFAKRASFHGEWDNMLLWNEMEKLTGIHIQWENASSAENVQEKKNLMIASGDLPDAFLSAGVEPGELVTLREENTFTRLNELIDKYAPNFKSALDKMPNIKKGLTLDDGGIYSFPSIIDGNYYEKAMSSKLFINEKWLRKIGMDFPSTTDELYTVLKAFKQKDPNGNGKQDEIPLIPQNGIGQIINALRGAWGLGNRGNEHQYIDIDPVTKKLRFIPTDTRYKEMLQYLNKLYSEGLLYDDILAMKSKDVVSYGERGLIGVFCFVNPIPIGQTHVEEYKGLKTALQGPHGDRMWSSMTPALSNMATFVITKANKYPEATVRWIDYFYGDEGMKLYWLGKEGVTYNKDDTGEFHYTKDIVHNTDGLTIDQAAGKYLIWPGIWSPSIETEKYRLDVGGSLPVVKEAAENLKLYAIKEVWPSFIYTNKEMEAIRSIESDMDTYISEKTIQFIIGSLSFSEWDNYVKELNKIGIDKYMEVQQAAYERYMGE